VKGALLAGAVFLAAALAWLARDPQFARHAYGNGSSLNTGPAGWSLARAYLAEREHAPVASLLRPLGRAQLPDGAVVIRAQPMIHAAAATRSGWGRRRDGGVDGGPDGGADAGSSLEEVEPPRRELALLRPDEERFVARGGRIVLALDGDHGPLAIEPAGEEPLQKVFPALPGVASLKTGERRGLGGFGLADAVAVFARGDAPAIARIGHGLGDVWLVANPEVLSNERLADADHLGLLIALAGGGRPVFFDEFAHGLHDDAGAVELLRRWGLGPACLLAAVAGLGWFWRRGATLGPASPWRDLRTESIDLAYAVGELYQRALKPRDQIALHHARLLHEITLRLGLRDSAAAAKARELLPRGFSLPAERERVGDAEVQQLIEQINEALRRLRDGHRHRR
jgi:hypothetical protein